MYQINTVLCLIKVNSNTIKLTVHPSFYCILDLLCVEVFTFKSSKTNNPLKFNTIFRWWNRLSSADFTTTTQLPVPTSSLPKQAKFSARALRRRKIYRIQGSICGSSPIWPPRLWILAATSQTSNAIYNTLQISLCFRVNCSYYCCLPRDLRSPSLSQNPEMYLCFQRISFQYFCFNF